MKKSEMLLLSAATASVMAEGLNTEELAVLAAFVTTVGDQLALIAACESNGASSPQL